MSPNGGVTIREAAPGDVANILELIRALAEYENLLHEVVATEAMLHEALFGERSHVNALIAEVDGHNAGFALYFFSYSTFTGKSGIYLEDLFVRPEYRGAGCGKKLLRRLAKIALDEDCTRLEWSVLDWNQPSRDFYLRLGAREMEEWITNRLDGDALRELAE